MKKFCPNCGKPIEKGTVCSDCVERTLEFKEIDVKICPSKKYFFHGKWTPFKNLKELTEILLSQSLKKKFKVIQGLEAKEDLLQKTGLQEKINVLVKIEGEEYELPINVEITISPSMKKVGTQYFEGLLQLRNANQEVKDYIMQYLEKNASKNVFVNKISDRGDEVDYFFVNKRQIPTLGLKLMRKFGAVISQSEQLFTFNFLRSKDVFRLNVLATLPKFKIGDVIIVDDKSLLVTEFGKITNCIDLNLNKRSTIRLSSKNVKEIVALPKLKTTISLVTPELQILDPDDYQSVSVKNPLNIFVKPGFKVNVVKAKGTYYLMK